MLISNYTNTLQALEKNDLNDYWITIILVALLISIAVLKLLNKRKLKGYAFSLFSRNFIEDELEEDTSLYNLFQAIISLFSFVVLSLVLYHGIAEYSTLIGEGLVSFLMVFLGLISYFLFKWGVEYMLSLLLKIRKTTRFFMVSKFSYLYSICFILFVMLIFVQYSQVKFSFLLYFSISLFLMRFILHIINNKKLIFSKLFYFILYLCAFEIAPLLIVFKLMF